MPNILLAVVNYVWHQHNVKRSKQSKGWPAGCRGMFLFKVAAFVLIKNYVAGSFRVSDLSWKQANCADVAGSRIVSEVA